MVNEMKEEEIPANPEPVVVTEVFTAEILAFLETNREEALNLIYAKLVELTLD